MDGKEKVRAVFEQVEMLTPSERDLIVERMVVEEFKKGEVLLRQGQVNRQCYFVLEGCIREYSLMDGDEKTNAFFTEGDGTQVYIGGNKDLPSDHTLECMEDCVLMVCKESMEEEIRALVPRLDALIQEVTKEKVAQVRAAMAKFMHSSPEERYAHLMEQKPFLFHRVPHHQIASFLGMKPQSLSRIRKRVFSKETES